MALGGSGSPGSHLAFTKLQHPGRGRTSATLKDESL